MANHLNKVVATFEKHTFLSQTDLTNNSELEDYDFKSLMDMHMMLGRGRLPNIFVHSAIAYINWPVYKIHVYFLWTF
jgi:hypothetical protein